MKFNKIIMFILLISMYAFLAVPVARYADLVSLYEGMEFDSTLYFYSLNFLLFISYSIYMYNEFESYMHEQGIFLVIRNKSRNKLFIHLVVKLLSMLFILETIKVLIFSCFMLAMRGTIGMNHFSQWIKIIVMNLMVYLIVLFVQMILELFFTGNTALLVITSYYLINLGLSPIFYDQKSIGNTFLIINYSMNQRLRILVNEFHLSYKVILVSLALFLVLLFHISRRLFLKKDII